MSLGRTARLGLALLLATLGRAPERDFGVGLFLGLGVGLKVSGLGLRDVFGFTSRVL